MKYLSVLIACFGLNTFGLAQSGALETVDYRKLNSANVDSLLLLAEAYLSHSPTAATQFAERAAQVIDSLNAGDQLKARAWLIVGKASYFEGSFYNSRNKLSIALEMASGGDSLLLADIHRSLGRTQKEIRQFEASLKNNIDAIAIYEALGRDEEMATVWVDMAEFYRTLSRIDKAKNYLRQAEELITEKDLSEELQAYYYHLSAALAMAGGDGVVVARPFAEKALELADRIGNVHLKATALNELGYMDFLEEKETALERYEQASLIWESIGYSRFRADVLVNIAVAYQKQNNIDQAFLVLEEAIGAARRNEWADIEIRVHNIKADIFERQGNYREALESQNMAFTIEIATSRNHFKKEIAVLEEEYQSARREEMLAEQQRKTEKATIDLALKTKQRNLVIISTVALFVIAIILALFYIRTRKTANRISTQKAEIEEMNKDLTSAVEQKDALYAELHHRVKNNLSILSGLLHLQEAQLDDELARQVLQDSQNRIQSIAMVHQRLYTDQDASDIDLQSYLTQLVGHLNGTMAAVDQDIDCQLDCDGIRLNITQAVPLALIINELFTNSFKYAFNDQKSGIIGVSVEEGKQGETIIEVFDNGPGLNIDSKLKNAETLGLKLISILADQLGAIMEYKNEGLSTFRFEIG